MEQNISESVVGVNLADIGMDVQHRQKIRGNLVADENSVIENRGIVSRVASWASSRIRRRSGAKRDASDREKQKRQKRMAWREKVFLCALILLACLFLAFLTYGMSMFVCRGPGIVYKHSDIVQKKNIGDRWYLVRGHIYRIPVDGHLGIKNGRFDKSGKHVGQEIGWAFSAGSACAAINSTYQVPCRRTRRGKCFTMDMFNGMVSLGTVSWEWSEIRGTLLVYNGHVLDFKDYFGQASLERQMFPFGKKVDTTLRQSVGRDSTRALSYLGHNHISCIMECFHVGKISGKTAGCLAVDIVLYITLVVILILVFVKFILAAIFVCFYAKRLEKTREGVFGRFFRSHPRNVAKKEATLQGPHKLSSRYATALNREPNLSHNSYSIPNSEIIPGISDKMHVILIVTCYSENEAGLRVTIESLAETDYADDRKLLFIISDGLVVGSGNTRSTPQILIDMIEIDRSAGTIGGESWSHWTSIPLKSPRKEGKKVDLYVSEQEGWLPQAYSYAAIVDGQKRHNMAMVFAGYFRSRGHRVATILVVKCGTSDEEDSPKPGNRGKRDSQIILMSFLSKIMCNDRITPLDYDIYIKISDLMGVPPSVFEAVLYIDADTKVLPSAITHMVNTLKADDHIMGLCGETQIENKSDTWVTRIQVFEYFISHYLNKAFETMFGGVTCLPGCFCMYRIFARKGPTGHLVLLLASTDIVDGYSETITDTLHKKNLLLLGEDRYLTTLMLKTFPKRKLVFVPAAVCKTVVPDTFSVLLSQRRRWINSTIHNLFELMFVPGLCGTFCCSMQFMVFVDLMGTAVLPAAIFCTGILIISSIVGEPQYIPLFLLAAVLGLPAVMILLIPFSPSPAKSAKSMFWYIFYMLVYFLSLPIWNFLFPAYAFWHFDDFSWGETRKLQTKDTKNDHSCGGTFEPTSIFMQYLQLYEAGIEKNLSQSYYCN